ncbi:MAG: hypothetical protein V4702_05385 [Patescibacteria group bacterium]
MITSQVSWRSGLSKKSGTLNLTDKLTLTDETGSIVFEVVPSELRSIKIQMNFIYLKVGGKMYSLNVSPEVTARKARGETTGREVDDIDQLTAQWKEALHSTGAKKVKRIPWEIFAIIIALMAIIRFLTN